MIMYLSRLPSYLTKSNNFKNTLPIEDRVPSLFLDWNFQYLTFGNFIAIQPIPLPDQSNPFL